jgi:flagellar hook protein FlgE
MMRSLYSAVTGLKAHQTKMDVIGNNVANVNTVGFKASRVIFQDIYSQTIAPASASTATRGGTNPSQIGLGVETATIDVLDTAASSQYTGNTLDLAIDGSGYFITSRSGSTTYTRAGNFYTDKDNYLVDSNGNYVQGYKVDTDGNLVTGTDGNPIIGNILVDPDYYDVSISSNGQVVGLDESTSLSCVIGQIVLATFANPNGLEKCGENSYRTTVNSGNPTLSTPGAGGAGTLNPGSLEMSNVDLTSQFADMIVTQRGFQANSRVITATDEMLQELVNMVRQ